MGVRKKNMKLSIAALAATALAASPEVFDDSEKVECYHCEYAWEVFEGEIRPIRGESLCRDGPLENVPTKSKKLFGTKESGFKYKHRCGYAHSIGQEILYEGDKQVVKEFHVFERKAFQISLDSSLADNEGDLILQEQGRFCGANRPECNGAFVPGMPSSTPCPDGETCPCMRCDAVRVTMNGVPTYTHGSPQCKDGTDALVDRGTCVADATVGGTCYIWIESYTNKANKVLEHEIINRSCDIKDVRSMNTYSELNSRADNMQICNGDLCNAPDLTGASSLLAPALAALLIALL